MSAALRPGLAWLVRLRWLAVSGQLVATAVALWVLDAPLSLPWLLTLIGVTAVSNVALMAIERRVSDRPGPRPAIGADHLVMGALVLDTALLTGMLLASGGVMNPFSVFFIVEVALAGLLVGAAGAWTMAALTSLAFGALFLLTPDDPHAHHHHGATPLHLQGMWIAYALAAGFVALFVSGIATALKRREQEVAALRERALGTERLAALSAFSAGAAHELGTPLGTIAVVSTELAHNLDRLAQERADLTLNTLAEDARVVRSEVERCRALLRDLSERSGAWAGETPDDNAVSDIVQAVIAQLSVAQRARVELAVSPSAAVADLAVSPSAAVADLAVSPSAAVADLGGEGTLVLHAPRRSLVQSLVNILRNALDAAPGKVQLATEGGAKNVVFRVTDTGPGFVKDVLERFGEPFVTTKPRGEGLGLGLFLALSFATNVGGSLRIGNRARGGAEVVLEVPRATRSRGPHE